MRRLAVLLLGIVLPPLLFGCGGDDESPTSPSEPPEPEPKIDRIEVQPDSARLDSAGATVDFDASALDQNGEEVTDVTFTWSSSDPSVATVDEQGTVEAQAEGSVRIQASAEGIEGSSQLVVSFATVGIVSPDDNSAIDEGESVTFEANAENPDGSAVANDQLRWRSDLDGSLGTGQTLTVDGPSVGTHFIKLEATLSKGATRRDSITLLVQESKDSVDRAVTSNDTDSGFMVGRILIRYEEDTPSNNIIARINREYGLESQRKIRSLPVYIATVQTDADSTTALAQRIREDSTVSASSVDVLTSPQETDDFDGADNHRQHNLTATELLWDRLEEEGVSSAGKRSDGSRVRLGIVDTGFDLSHSDFSSNGKVHGAADIGLFGVTQGAEEVSNDTDHGTAVASIALGGNSPEGADGLTGIAPGAQLVPVRVGVPVNNPLVPGDIEESISSATEIAIGIDYAIGAGAEVINISLGIINRDVISDGEQFLRSTGLRDALDRAREDEVVVVISSGNCGADYSQGDPLVRASPQALIVGGTNVDGTDIFSRADEPGKDGECPGDRVQSQGGSSLDVVAPGIGLRAAEAGTASGDKGFSGTSAAAPVVAGLVAAYLSAGHTPLDAAGLVERRAIDLAADGSGLGTDGEDNRTGRGRVIAGVGLKDLEPASVPAGEPTTITANGRNFSSNVSVLVNGNRITPTEVRSHRELTFDVQPASEDDPLSVRIEHPSGLQTDVKTLSVGTTPQQTGDLKVGAFTAGQDQDLDGYTVKVDGSRTANIDPNGSTTFTDLSVGDHEVELSAIRPNCTTEGPNPRTIEVEANETASLNFSVTCTTEPGALEVSASTSGENPDTDGYTVIIDGAPPASIGPNGSTTFTGLSAGSHSVQLSDIKLNCSVDGSNPKTVDVIGGETRSVSFSLSCTSETGDLEISVSTSGQDPDSDGYTVLLDESESGSIDANGSTTLTGVSAGEHEVGLSGLQSHCSVDGNNPQTVNVPPGDAESVNFSVSCSSQAGGLLAYYPLNGDVSDVSGNEKDGTINGDPSFGSGRDGQALALDGQDDYVELPSVGFGEGSFTIAGWVNLDSFSTPNTLYSNGEGTPACDDGIRRFGTSGDGRVQLRVANCEDQQGTTPTTLSTGQWYHIAITVDKSSATARIYIDGNQDTSFSVAGLFDDLISSAPHALGVFVQADGPNKAGWFDGRMDEVRFYGRALSTSEIESLAQ